MEVQEGVVFRVYDKAYQGKTLYSFKLDGIDGYFRLGEDPRSDYVQEGWKIKVGYDVDARGNSQVKKVKVLDKSAPKPAPQRRGGGSSPQTGSLSKEEWAEKDRKIQYQSARNAAIEAVKVLVQGACVPLPAKTKLEERRVAVEALIDELTKQYFEDTNTYGAVARAGGETDAPTEAPEDDFGDDSTAEAADDDNDFEEDIPW